MSPRPTSDELRLLDGAKRFFLYWRSRDIAFATVLYLERKWLFARDKSGGAFVVCEDATVWMESSEGESHRLADSLRTFLARLAGGFTVADLAQQRKQPSECPSVGVLRWLEFPIIGEG